MSWRPATKTNVWELFEVRREANFYFYGSYGDSARVYADAKEGIAVECNPEDRAAVIEALSALLELMKEPKPTEPDQRLAELDAALTRIKALEAENSELKVRDSNVTFHSRNVMAVNQDLKQRVEESDRRGAILQHGVNQSLLFLTTERDAALTRIKALEGGIVAENRRVVLEHNALRERIRELEEALACSRERYESLASSSDAFLSDD